VQGELKIPGFSQYLHPYADNLVIGFGMDAVEDVTRTTGLTLGFKVAMYDVSDPGNSKELSTFYIGDRSTYSDLSSDYSQISRIEFEIPKYDYPEPVKPSEPVYTSSTVSKVY